VKNSPISSIFLSTREFLVKRDDLIDPFLAGNKYRKLYTLLNTPSEQIKKVISYGGTQSNAMLAIAAMCKTKEWEFIYYTKPISETQKKQSIGNYANALSLGMKHVEVDLELYKKFIASLRVNLEIDTVIIDQGGADKIAMDGVGVLAQEIREANLDVDAIATPSGTGTTALYLALCLPEYKVYTTPSIGSVEYLKEQMMALEKIPENLVILESEKRYHFAKPYKEFLDIYGLLKDGGIEFDLLYAPLLWKCLLEQTTEKILYVHSGGVSGNQSMLNRYRQKNYI
jgi:1-aminocyclopropane-1-carboxylate deaminase